MANFSGDQLFTFMLTDGYIQAHSGIVAPNSFVATTIIKTPAQSVYGPLDLFLMRGFDTNGSVNHNVYWIANSIDATASQYTGSVGPVTNIVYVKRI